jgi:hypothetical protein
VEDTRQLGLVRTVLGEAGSGLARYGAAMHFYQRRLISSDTLEVYRACALEDGLDPLSELLRLGLTHDIQFLKETPPS